MAFSVMYGVSLRLWPTSARSTILSRKPAPVLTGSMNTWLLNRKCRLRKSEWPITLHNKILKKEEGAFGARRGERVRLHVCLYVFLQRCTMGALGAALDKIMHYALLPPSKGAAIQLRSDFRPRKIVLSIIVPKQLPKHPSAPLQVTDLMNFRKHKNNLIKNSEETPQTLKFFFRPRKSRVRAFQRPKNTLCS